VAGLRGLCASVVAPMISRATSCSAVLVQDPSAPDGTYTIDVAGRRFAVYCRNMQRARRGLVLAPSQYISLPVTGVGENVSEYAAGGASPGTSVTTTYTKIRVNPYPESIRPLTFSVEIADETFSRSSGRLCHSDASTPCPSASAVRSMPYATAFSCDPGGFSGRANIDLTGTSFAVVDSFTAQGAGPVGTVKFLSPQVVNLTGGGYCGWEAPALTYNPFDRNPLDDIRRGYDLKIRFDPAAARGRQ
jgi:GON domain